MRRGQGKLVRRLSLVSVAALSLAVIASPATASVTVGQTDPSNSPMVSCAGVVVQDMAQPSVTSGNSYVVPADGTITSWSHNAYSGANQKVTMKVWRLISGTSYRVIGHDTRGPFTGSGPITFSGISVPVQRGDVLGLNAGTGGFVDCMFPAPGDTMLYANPSDTPDGQETNFVTLPDRRPNISAVVEPTNSFTPGAVTRNKKKGSATLAFNLPNPGDLSGSGQGAQVASTGAVTSKAVPAGIATLVVKAKGKKKRKLNETGKVKLIVAITYTPTGGSPSTQSVKVKLKKKL